MLSSVSQFLTKYLPNFCAGFPGGSRKESEEETKYETGEERVTRTHDSGQSLQQYTDTGIIIYTCTSVEDVQKFLNLYLNFFMAANKLAPTKVGIK